MADEMDDPKTADAVVETKAAALRSDSTSPARRPYTAPKLRYLGKVAEITFGAGASSYDNVQHHIGKKPHT